MMRSVALRLMTLVLAYGSLPIEAGRAATLYVAPDGDDTGRGTIESPFATIPRAQQAIRELRAEGNPTPEGARVVLRRGTYQLDEPLRFKAADSGVTYQTVHGEDVVISGGRPINGWKKQDGDLWTVTLPEVAAGRWYFRQLFAGEKRLTRARTPNQGHFLTVGPLSKYAPRLAAKRRYGGYNGVSRFRREIPDIYCGFQFRPGDIEAWPDADNAEIITFHSWECSWQTIQKIDLENCDVVMNSPCRYPIGFFSSECRYRIENVEAALDRPGEWLLDRKTGTLSYLAAEGEDPNRMEIVAPAVERLIVIEGEPESGEKVENLAFDGIRFRYAQYPMGGYDVAPNWPEDIQRVFPEWPDEFPPGYTDSQAAPRAGQAIELTDASHIRFVGCEMAHLGAYAVKIGRRCHHNSIAGCHMHDLGGGGVLIGMDVRNVERAGVPRSDAPSHNRVENCVIEHASRVHPSAVGVWIAQSHHNTIGHNEIADIGYAGVHLGWTWGREPNYSDHNLILSNDIHHAMRDLADAGGLYSLGILEGSCYEGNYIHDIRRTEGAIGAPTDGIFFDQGSRDIVVENNVLQNVGESVIRFNQCVKDDMHWGWNFLNEEGPADAETQARIDAIVEQAGPLFDPRRGE